MSAVNSPIAFDQAYQELVEKIVCAFGQMFAEPQIARTGDNLSSCGSVFRIGRRRDCRKRREFASICDVVRYLTGVGDYRFDFLGGMIVQ